MSEFERTRRDSAGTESTSPWFPADFTPDEAAFASELRELFPLEEEILPPHFIQTVIEDDWHSMTPPGFEQKLTYNVFARLSLPRGPLFPKQPRAPWHNVRQRLNRTSRPVAASFVLVALAMIFSVIVATPSFAAGMQLLLAHTGVRQVDRYPEHVQSPTATRGDTSTTLAYDALTPAFPISYLGSKADKYAFAGVQLLPAESWSDGPIVEMQYAIPHDSPGSGILDIREFKVSPNYSAVLQAVQAGSAAWVSLDGRPAVYIDGIWTDPVIHRQPMMDTPIWQFGVRSELMVERNGVVFWIVGDQRDGANQAELVKLAGMLTETDMRSLRPLPITLHGLGESVKQIFQKPRGREVLVLMPRGSALTTPVGITFQSNNISY